MKYCILIRRDALVTKREPVWPSGKARARLVSKRTLIRSASALLSPQNLWFMDTLSCDFAHTN